MVASALHTNVRQQGLKFPGKEAGIGGRADKAELFSQVACLSLASAGDSLFITIQMIFNLLHTNKN